MKGNITFMLRSLHKNGWKLMCLYVALCVNLSNKQSMNKIVGNHGFELSWICAHGGSIDNLRASILLYSKTYLMRILNYLIFFIRMIIDQCNDSRRIMWTKKSNMQYCIQSRSKILARVSAKILSMHIWIHESKIAQHAMNDCKTLCLLF